MSLCSLQLFSKWGSLFKTITGMLNFVRNIVIIQVVKFTRRSPRTSDRTGLFRGIGMRDGRNDGGHEEIRERVKRKFNFLTKWSYVKIKFKTTLVYIVLYFAWAAFPVKFKIAVICKHAHRKVILVIQRWIYIWCWKKRIRWITKNCLCSHSSLFSVSIAFLLVNYKRERLSLLLLRQRLTSKADKLPLR